jgi:hypothetical protein
MKSNITVLFELCIKAPAHISDVLDQNKSVKIVFNSTNGKS